MIVAITAMLAVTLGCAVVLVIQLAVLAFHLGDMKAYAQTQIALLQRIDEKLTPPPAEDRPTEDPAAILTDEQVLHNTVRGLNDLRRTNRENPRYPSCKSAAVAWINAAYERLR